ncbi:uncharacterized protein LOC103719904 [Phoenix dactylifera]|uniref:Uncharacterized protein LOC103719904 n=1 Tax=Phoenix dactylifera TaxID=42345 RepID=A0A8B8ZJ51_PHODC|nr:uncharacterized protein LOC103719904 [Phoenix dactylifera]
MWVQASKGVGLVDRYGIPLSDWYKDVDLLLFENSDEEILQPSGNEPESIDADDGSHAKRVIMAETEASIEKERVNLGMEEIRRKTLQIDSMSAKVEEIKKVEEMAQETPRQQQRAAENEQELCHVKKDFEVLTSYLSSHIIVRETTLSSEKQFQSMEKLFERSTILMELIVVVYGLITKIIHLEVEKVLKEAEVQNLMKENVRLTAMLDKEEAQLLAVNDQLKFM